MPRLDFRLARRSVVLGTAFLATAIAGGCARQAVDSPPRSVVFFTAQSAQLDAPAMGVIREFVADAKSVPTRPVLVMGFADSVGTPEANRMLSALRAKVVADELVAEGIAPNRISQRPRGATDSDPGLESRRVELQIVR